MVRSDRNDCPNVNLLLLHSLAADSQFACCARNGSELGDGWSPAGLIRSLRTWCDKAGMNVEFNQFMNDRRECMEFAFAELDRLKIQTLRFVSLCASVLVLNCVASDMERCRLRYVRR